MFRSIFRPYSLVWNILNTVTDILGLSLLWLVFCLPIVTIGPATTALYDAVVHGIRYKEPGPYRRFLKTFRSEWKTGLLGTLLWGVILGVFGYGLTVLLVMAGQDRSYTVYAGVYFGVLLLPLSCAIWSATILSRFTFSFGALTATAFRFTLGQFPRSLALGLVTAGVVWFTLHYPIWVFLSPACMALAWSVFTEPVFAKYGGGLKVTTEEDALPSDPG